MTLPIPIVLINNIAEARHPNTTSATAWRAGERLVVNTPVLHSSDSALVRGHLDGDASIKQGLNICSNIYTFNQQDKTKRAESMYCSIKPTRLYWLGASVKQALVRSSTKEKHERLLH